MEEKINIIKLEGTDLILIQAKGQNIAVVKKRELESFISNKDKVTTSLENYL